MSKLTVEHQKRQKALELSLLTNENRLKSAFSFGKIKTYRDFLLAAGYPSGYVEYIYSEDQLAQRATLPLIKEWVAPARIAAALDQHIASLPPNPNTVEEFFYDAEHKVSHKVSHTSTLVVSEALAKLDVEATQESRELQTEIDSILPLSPKERATLFEFQAKAAMDVLHRLLEEHKPGLLLQAGVGLGKTFIVGAVLRRFLDMNYAEGKTLSPWPYVYVTRATVVSQTELVLRECFGISTTDVKVINIEQLRASFGELMLQEKTVVELGEAHIVWQWRQHLHPMFIVWDECQALKNEGSQQSKIGQAFNDIDPARAHTRQLFVSATPFTRVCEAKCISVATRLPINYGMAKGIPLTNKTWSDWSKQVAHPAEPEEHSEAAIERLMRELDPYVVSVKGVRPQFRAKNGVQKIHFRTEQEREGYQKAWDDYLAEKAKLEGSDSIDPGSLRMMILVQFLKFRQAAERIRAPYIAESMYATVQAGKAACCACNFKTTIALVVKHLVYDYNVPRSMISLIWGGGATKRVDKKKLETKRKLEGNAALLAILKDAGVDVNEDLDFDNLENSLKQEASEKTLYTDPLLDLGAQSKKERQREIDKFQSGKSHYCLFTFKSGGVGLSLHHSDDKTTQKVRKKKNGYAYVEDIPSIPVRPRELIATPTYSAIELVQGLGRCPRLTSLSDTPQTIVFYAGTIEERVAATVSAKLRCLRKVVRQRESWEDVITTPGSSKMSDAGMRDGSYMPPALVAPVVDDEEDAGLIGVGSGGEDDEDEDEDDKTFPQHNTYINTHT